jgi:hypothetical protein
MIAQNSEPLGLENLSVDEEEFSIPLDISDIINICREYNKLGWQIQNQVESILDIGIEESIKINVLKKESLSHIKNFLKRITDNAYFGDATTQAEDCINLIEMYEDKHKIKIVPRFN